MRRAIMAKWAYTLSFDDQAGSRDDFKKFLDSCPLILDWAYILPYTFLIVSSTDAQTLTTHIRSFTRDRGSFLIVDVSGDKSGWLPKAIWDMMTKPDAPPPPPIGLRQPGK
jgi:hypothetical protein